MMCANDDSSEDDDHLEQIWLVIGLRMGKYVFCVLCILCVFLQQKPKKYGQDLMCFFSRDIIEQCCSFQTITDPCVLCVLCVFFGEFILQILWHACVLRVLCVLCVFFSRDMTEQCCSFQTITDPCVLCVLCVFLEFIRQILCHACVLRVLCVFFQET